MAHAHRLYDLGKSDEVTMEYSTESVVTPVVPTLTSRKRKATETVTSENLYTKQTPSFDTSQIFDSKKWNENFLSSTLNESITNDFEKFNLDSFASNYYIERSDIMETPTSTQSQEPASKSACVSKIQQAKEPATPTKAKSNFFMSASSSPMQKLGSPERNEILYPTLYRTGSIRYPLDEYSKRFSPAKKRLFTRLKHDPIYFFWNKSNKYPNIISQIFSNLCDEDLYCCSRVSRNWKCAVNFDPKIKERIQRFVQNKVMNKENCISSVRRCESSPIEDSCCVSPFIETESPVLQVSKNIYEITNTLRDGQHLEKCVQCCEPSAIVDHNISQCTRELCGFIRCLKCNSISTTGPEKFVDSCQQSGLLVNKPKSKYSLMTSPPRGVTDSGVPSFFLEDSLSYSPTMNTSGYVTDSDGSLHSDRRSASFTKGMKSHILQNCNSDLTTTRRSTERRSSVVPVVPLNVKKVKEVIEPSSPPKVKDVACSRRSRHNLRRLRF